MGTIPFHFLHNQHLSSLIPSINLQFNYILFLMYQQSGSLVQSARQSFVKKVYSIISMQLTITVLAVYLSIQYVGFAKFLLKNTWVFWTSLIGGVVTLVALFFGSISKKFPINYLVMTAFTLFESILVSYTCMFYEPSSVLLAAVATLSATLGLTYYAMTTKQDFTANRFVSKGIFYSLAWVVTTVSLFNFIFLRSGLVAYGLAIAFALIYSVYLLIDTQMILGNRQKSVDLDNYVLGATIIYMDIISLFLKLLKILGKKKRDD